MTRVAFVGARVLSGLAHRGLQRSGARPIAVDLLSNLVRGGLYFVAVQAVDGVHDDPPAQVLLMELGDSSVNFEVRYWTDAAMGMVRSVQDRVLSDAKSALDDAGLTIPWPVRTLVLDTPITIDRNGARAT